MGIWQRSQRVKAREARARRERERLIANNPRGTSRCSKPCDYEQRGFIQFCKVCGHPRPWSPPADVRRLVPSGPASD